MISLVIQTYNEEHRLEDALKVATLWTDNIFIVDKSSTDNTVQIAKNHNCKVISIPYSDQGHENYVEYWLEIFSVDDLNNNFYLWLTPGEIPTRKLIDYCNRIIHTPEIHNIDVICLPVRIHSFGILRDWGPWKISHQPRLLNKKLVKIRNTVHSHIVITSNSRIINDTDDMHIYHPTHNDFYSFMRSHIDYARVEKFDSTDDMRLSKALTLSQQFDHELFNKEIDKDIRPFLAWKIYCYMVALYTVDKSYFEDTKNRLINSKLNYLKNEWGL